MSIDLDDVRKAMAAQIVEQTEKTVHVYERIPLGPSTPAAVITPSRSGPLTMQRGIVETPLTVLCIVDFAGDHIAAQKMLDAMLAEDSDRSVIAALRHDTSFGLAGVASHVGGWSNYGRQSLLDEHLYIGAGIDVAVAITKGA